jgi:hypothetical protein
MVLHLRDHRVSAAAEGQHRGHERDEQDRADHPRVEGRSGGLGRRALANRSELHLETLDLGRQLGTLRAPERELGLELFLGRREPALRPALRSRPFCMSRSASRRVATIETEPASGSRNPEIVHGSLQSAIT